MKTPRPWMLLALAAALLVSADTPPKPDTDALARQLIGQEQRVLEALRARDAAPLRSLVADDYQAIDGLLGPGRHSKADLLALLPDLRLSGYVPDDIRAVPLITGAFILTHRAVITATLKGKPLPAGPYYVSTTWVNRGGRWLLAFQQTSLTAGAAAPVPVGPPAPPPETAHGIGADLIGSTLRSSYEGRGQLQDVTVKITVRLENGTPLTFEKYWGSWQTGEVKEELLPLAGVRPVERLDLTVRATRDGKEFSGSITLFRR